MDVSGFEGPLDATGLRLAAAGGQEVGELGLVLELEHAQGGGERHRRGGGLCRLENSGHPNLLLADGLRDAIQEDREVGRRRRRLAVHRLGVVADRQVALKCHRVGVQRVGVFLRRHRLQLQMELLDPGQTTLLVEGQQVHDVDRLDVVLLRRPVPDCLRNVLVEILEPRVVFHEIVELLGSYVVEDAVLVESAWVRAAYELLRVISDQGTQQPLRYTRSCSSIVSCSLISTFPLLIRSSRWL